MITERAGWYMLVRCEAYASVGYSLLLLVLHALWPDWIKWSVVLSGTVAVFGTALVWVSVGYLVLASYEKTERDFEKTVDEIWDDVSRPQDD